MSPRTLAKELDIIPHKPHKASSIKKRVSKKSKIAYPKVGIEDDDKEDEDIDYYQLIRSKQESEAKQEKKTDRYKKEKLIGKDNSDVIVALVN